MNSQKNMTQDTLFTTHDKTPTTHQNAVAVLVPFPVDKAYDYAVPAGMDIRIGDYVVVPFKSRDVTGVVWGTPEGKSKKLKTILHKHDVPPLPEAHRKFIDWAARYTVSPLGSVLKMTLNTPKALEEEKPTTGYMLNQ